MPSLSSAVPKYRRHRASGQAIVTIAGRDQYLGPYGTQTSKREYDRLVGEWLAAGRPTAVVCATSATTVAEVILAFWKYAKQRYRKHGRATGTHENYKPALRLLRRRYGHTLASNFGPLALKALRQAMIETGNSRRYINENIQRIRKVFRWAAGGEGRCAR